MKSWEIEKMLKDDNREKKKTGSGAFHMRGKGVRHGFRGALRTPYHFMKNKEKNNLNGEVETYNMYETIIPYQEFKMKNIDVQKAMLTRWREIFETEKIKEDMKLTSGPFYKLLEELEIPKIQRGGKKAKKIGKTKRTEKKIAISSSINAVAESVQQSFLDMHSEDAPLEAKLITSGMHFEYNGEYDIEQLTKLFTKLQLLLDGEPNKFNISLSLTEKTD